MNKEAMYPLVTIVNRSHQCSPIGQVVSVGRTSGQGHRGLYPFSANQRALPPFHDPSSLLIVYIGDKTFLAALVEVMGTLQFASYAQETCQDLVGIAQFSIIKVHTGADAYDVKTV